MSKLTFKSDIGDAFNGLAPIIPEPMGVGGAIIQLIATLSHSWIKPPFVCWLFCVAVSIVHVTRTNEITAYSYASLFRA